MSESVVADFVAEVLYADRSDNEPVQCRVLLSRERLVVASQDRRTTVPLSDVYDVAMSQVPEHLAEFLDQTVMIRYREDDELRRMIVSGEHDKIEKFTSFLYKATLQQTPVTVRHPTMRGGRILDAEAFDVGLQIKRDTLHLAGEETNLQIDLGDVIDVTERERTIDGATVEVLEARYVVDGTVRAAEFHHESRRRQNLLRRYLRRRLYEHEELVEEYGPSEVEKRALTALYAGVDHSAVGDLIDTGSNDVGTILRALGDVDLVTDGEDGGVSNLGRVAVVQRYRESAG